MRVYSILMDLFQSREYLRPGYFSDKYCVSLRTIQNDLAYLRTVAPQHGFELRNKKGKGFLAEIHDREAAYAFAESMRDDRVVRMDARPSRILSFLAIQKDYISMDRIAEEFSLSKAQIRQDMDKVERLAEKEKIRIDSRSHYGIRLVSEGSHLHRYLVRQYMNADQDVMHAIDAGTGSFSDMQVLFTKQLNKEGLKINYSELISTMAWLRVLVFGGAGRDGEEAVHFTAADPINRIAYTMTKALEKKYGFRLSDQGRREMLAVLTHNIRIEQQQSFDLERLEKDLDAFMEEIDRKYDMDFASDEFFKKMLTIHTSLLLERLNNKISYRNPLASELNIKNPMVFDIAIQFCNMLKENYGVQSTFDEIGFVAAHFAAHIERKSQEKLDKYSRIGIVCSSGGGIAYMLQMQIQPLFKDASIQTFSFLQTDELQKYQPDLVFTVIPLSIKLNAPVILIRELLDSTDLNRIRQILQSDVKDPYSLMSTADISETLFRKEFFEICDDTDYEHLIRRMAMDLEREGWGEQGYESLVMEREKYVSTVYMNGVCIPHPIETAAIRNVISIAILRKPFVWNEKPVRIVFMICLRKEQVEVYKKITKKLFLLMRNSEYVDRITRVGSYEEMLAVFREMEGLRDE